MNKPAVKRVFLCIFCVFLIPVSHAQNKVVVIPLGGEKQNLIMLPQMELASVNANGEIVFATPGIDVLGSDKQPGVIGGIYRIDLNRDISMYTAQVTLGHLQQGSQVVAGEARVERDVTNAQRVFVDTNDSSGENADLPFNLLVVCPPQS